MRSDFEKAFQKDLGLSYYLLGIEATHSSGDIILPIRKYLMNLLIETCILRVKLVETYMKPNVKLKMIAKWFQIKEDVKFFFFGQANKNEYIYACVCVCVCVKTMPKKSTRYT